MLNVGSSPNVTSVGSALSLHSIMMLSTVHKHVAPKENGKSEFPGLGQLNGPT